MCSYCGCRDIGPIRDLTLEHVQIRNLMGEVRRAVERDDLPAAVEHLTSLLPILAAHDAVEELSIYPAMENVPMQAEKVGILFDEHDQLDDILEEAMTRLRASGPAAIDWPAVLGGFAMLWEHIDHEENGLFPAAAIAFENEDWERAEEVRAAVSDGQIQTRRH